MMSIIMAYVAHTYNNLNDSQQSHAKSLMDYLLEKYPKRVFDTIVDIGSGSGNVTKQLAIRIPHKRILALDIDPDMTQFSKANNSSDTIEYITEDIGKPWDQLNNTLKELEGKATLVFSNRVLHWVEDKETAVKNISKLLAIGADFCANMTPIQDLSPHLSPQFNDNFTKIPSIDEQFDIWRKLFIKYGIKLSFADNFYVETYYERSSFLDIWPSVPKLYLIYVKSKDPFVREKVVNDSTFKNIVFDSTFCWKTEFKLNSYQEFMDSEANGITLPYKQFRYIGQKF